MDRSPASFPASFLSPSLLHRLIIPFLLVAAASIAHAQTTLTTQDGMVFHGRIIRRGIDSLRLVTTGGDTVTIAHLQIASIVDDADRPHPPSTNSARALPPPPPSTEKEPKRDILLAGISIFTPAGINLILGFRAGKLGARLSGLYLDKHYGAQLDFLFNLERSRTFSQDFFVGIGVADNVDNDGIGVWGRDGFRYTAFGYNVNFIGIYGGIGLAVGEGRTNRAPQVNPVFQIGYVREGW